MTKKPTYQESEQRIKGLEKKEAIYKKLNGYSKNEIKVKLEKPEIFKDIITNNEKMISTFQHIESVSSTSQPILITGETGVGKELIAKAIHWLSGLKGQIVAVNVAGLDDILFSDTLFGHTKGAYTGADKVRDGLIEQAAGGTLFFDEIGDLSLASQVKLLRLLQEGEYLPLGLDKHKKAKVRIVATTNQDLWTLQKAGRFRNDLNFRIRTHHIHIPPLRERIDDIPLLVDHFLDNAARTLNKRRPTPPKELFTLLKTYNFPGNIRELQAMIFDSVSRQKTNILSLDTFNNYIFIRQENGVILEQLEPTEDLIITFSAELPTIKQATQLLVAEAMRRTNGNQSIAARMLGISQPALSKRLKSAPQPL